MKNRAKGSGLAFSAVVVVVCSLLLWGWRWKIGLIWVLLAKQVLAQGVVSCLPNARSRFLFVLLVALTLWAWQVRQLKKDAIKRVGLLFTERVTEAFSASA